MTRTLNGYLRGFAHGVLATTSFFAIYSVFVLATGQSFRVAGRWGETNTRDVLRSARRRGYIYGWVDDLEVQGGDVDHLVVTPVGLLAIDSKWHGHELTADHRRA